VTVADLRPQLFTDLDEPAWLRLFDNIQRSWFRLETLQNYAVDYERAEYDQFLATGDLDRPLGEWQHMIRRHTNAGRCLQRVHVVVEPLTDYLRYELAAYIQNSEAGEDIRLIPVRGDDWPPDLPLGDDFWLFDETEVWDMHYDTQGQFLKAARAASSTRIEQCVRWRDLSLAQAVTLADYLRTAA